jgi:hypothetical protein
LIQENAADAAAFFCLAASRTLAPLLVYIAEALSVARERSRNSTTAAKPSAVFRASFSGQSLHIPESSTLASRFQQGATAPHLFRQQLRLEAFQVSRRTAEILATRD